MRRLIGVGVLLFFSSLSYAVPVRVQSSSAAVDSSNTNPVTLANPPANGSDEFACIGIDSGTRSVSSISQTGATWVRLTQFQDPISSTTVEGWGALGVSGAGTTITVNISGGNVANGATVSEYSGLPTANVFDVSNNNEGINATQTDTGLTATTHSANGLWISCNFQRAGVSALVGGVAPALVTPNNGYTLVAQVHTQLGGTISQWKNTGYMDKIVTATGQAGNTCTTDQSGNTNFRYTATAIALNGFNMPPSLLTLGIF